MKKYLLIGLLAGLTIGMNGCATYVGPAPYGYVEAPVAVDVITVTPEPFIFFYGPYYGPIWNGYYWSGERHCYYRPHGGWHGPIGHVAPPPLHGPVGHPPFHGPIGQPQGQFHQQGGQPHPQGGMPQGHLQGGFQNQPHPQGSPQGQPRGGHDQNHH